MLDYFLNMALNEYFPISAKVVFYLILLGKKSTKTSFSVTYNMYIILSCSKCQLLENHLVARAELLNLHAKLISVTTFVQLQV